MKGMSLLTTFHPLIKFPLLTPLIIPLLNHISSVKSFALVVERVFILTLGLEVWIVDVKVTAIEIVLYASVG
jgi:hypothetical protein